MTPRESRVIEQLAASPVFGRLGDAALRALAAVATTSTRPKGTILVRRGEAPDELLLVLRGSLDVWRQVSSSRRMHLRRLGRGDFVGWSIVAGEEHTADLVAGSKLEFARIPGRTIRRLFRDHPQVPLQMIASLGALVGKLSDEIAELRFNSLDQRVFKTVLRLAGGTRRLDITQAELAEAVGASRANVARALGRLDSAGLVARGRGWIEPLRE